MNFTVRDVTLRSLTTFVVFSFVFLFAGCAGLFDETPPDSGACGMEYRPVCGVNNQVYLNPCFANRSGVVVANEGECRPTASCDDNDLGRDVLVKGTVTTENGSFTDRCLSENSVLEFFCANNKVGNQSVTCPENYLCVDGVCIVNRPNGQQPLLNGSQPQSALCWDTDFGQNYFVKGTVNVSSTFYNDVCVDSGFVKEYYCQNNSLMSVNYPCPGGYECLFGRCVGVEPACTDSDGRDIYRGGVVTVYSGSSRSTYQDTCLSDRRYLEYSCSNNNVASEDNSCPSGYVCSSGACVLQGCSDTDSENSAYIRGSVTKGDRIESDYCADTVWGTEWYCSGNEIHSMSFSCPSDYRCDSGRCIRRTSCTDNDGGLNYVQLGTTSSTYDGSTETDYCLSGDRTVREFYCSADSRVIHQDYNCDYEGKICRDGRCVVPDSIGWCTETDGGVNYFTRGSISDSTGYSDLDYCLPDGKTLHEFFCPSATARSNWQNYDCSVLGSGYSCSDGRCIYTTPPILWCVDSDSGINEFIPGSVSIGTGSTTSVSARDTCTNPTTVSELYCPSPVTGLIPEVLKSCPSGYACVDEGSGGYCKLIPSITPTCTETDLGNDPVHAGTTTAVASDGTRTVSPDACSSSSRLIEYYCNADGSYTYAKPDCATEVLGTTSCYDPDGSGPTPAYCR